MYLQQYLDKTDFKAKNVNLESLNALIKKHIELFPFSSTNVLLERELSLENKSLFKRVINDNNGGYCFEHNKIFYHILKELGYEVRTLMARVTLGGSVSNARTHRVNLVTIEGEDYLVDVGFGSLGPSVAISIYSEIRTRHNGSAFVVRELDEEFYLQNLKNESLTLYVFDLAKYSEKDCELGHFYSHKHPEAIFVNHLVVSKILENKVIHILNNIFITEEGSSELKVEITSKDHLAAILEFDFGMTFSELELETLFNKVKSRSSEIVA